MTILLSQLAASNTAARDSQHGLQEQPTLGFLASVDSGMAMQKGLHFSPIAFSKSHGRHVPDYALNLNRTISHRKGSSLRA
jgi:hypothetical protein